MAFDLFSGAGGLSLGLKQAGFSVVGAVEIDSLSVETYRMNHPEVCVWNQDIRSVNPAEILKVAGLAPGELDLLAGCPPCQGFSTLRTRRKSKSVSDQRNDLVLEYLRFAVELAPKVIMMENVPNLIRDYRLQAVVDGLKSLGYQMDVESVQVLDVAAYGVPQRRKRMILIASKLGIVEFARPSHYRRTVASAIRYLPLAGSSGDELHDYRQKRSERITRMIASVPKDGGSRDAIPAELQLKCHSRSDGFKDVYGRMKWDDVAPTITSGCHNPSKGRFLHPEEDRAITLREAALLQSFPATYRFSLARGRELAAAQIGNALPPEFVRRHASAIHKHLDQLEV